MFLCGGGRDQDGIMRRFLRRSGGGDILILRTSGGDGYNDYLHRELGGCSSVTSLVLNGKSHADSDYVVKKIRKASGIFFAGGNQRVAIDDWRNSRLAKEVEGAVRRGATVGCTSSGLAEFGEYAYSARYGGLSARGAVRQGNIRDLEKGIFRFPRLKGVVLDSHVDKRKARVGAFVREIGDNGWNQSALGVGIEEKTAVEVGPDGWGTVAGRGNVYVFKPAGGGRFNYRKLRSGDRIHLPDGETPGIRGRTVDLRDLLD